MEGKVWQSQQLQNVQSFVMPTIAYPEIVPFVPSSDLVHYCSSPACAVVTLGSNTVSTMMASCSFPPNLVSATPMPSGFANASLTAADCTNVTNQAMALQSLEVVTSALMPPIQNNQTLFIPSNVVGQTMVVHTNTTNQSLMLPPGVSNSAAIVHSNQGNPVMPFNNPHYVLDPNPIMETNITFTQKVVFPNSHITNVFMPGVTVPSSSYDFGGNHNSFVSSVTTETSSTLLETGFTGGLQPKCEVNLEPAVVGNINLNLNQVQLQHLDMHLKSDALSSSAPNITFLQQTSHSAFSHVRSSIPLPGMIFSHKESLSSQVGALNINCLQKFVSDVTYSPLYDNLSNNNMLSIEPFAQVAHDGEITKPLAADIDTFQQIAPSMEYSYQQVMHSMESSKQQVASDRDSSQYVTCSTDLSQQVTFSTDLSQQVLPSAECSQQVTCNTNTSQQVTYSTDLSQPFVPSIVSSQQVTDCVKQVTFNTDLSQKVTSSSDLSLQVTSSTDLSQQITPSTDSSQHVIPRICSSQQVTESVKHIKCSKNLSQQVKLSSYSPQQVPGLSQQVTHAADSCQKLGFNVNTVQQVTCNIIDLQNIAQIVDISQQVPSSMGSMQQLVSQMMPQVETSTISSQVVSTLAYSKQAAFGTNSLQKLAVLKELFQQFETSSICPGKINPDEFLKQNTLGAGSEQITPDVCSEQNIIDLCPKEIVPDVDVFQNVLPCDVKIKTEPLETYNETSVVGSAMQFSPTTDTSEVKLEPKLEETETVCCNAYISSEHFVTPKIKTDPLSTFLTATGSLPATSSTSYSQDIKPDSSEEIDDLVPRMPPNGGHPQIMLFLPLIHLGGEFQNTDNAQAVPSGPSATVDNCTTLVTPMLPGDSGVRYGFVPSLGGIANPYPSHNQLQTLEVAGKLPIPRLKVNKPAPQVKTFAPKSKLKLENILKPTITKNIFPSSGSGAEIQVEFQAAGTSGIAAASADIQLASTLNISTSTCQRGSQNGIQGGKKHLTSNSALVGSSKQSVSKADQVDKVVTTSQNNSKNSSLNKDAVPVMNSVAIYARGWLQRNRLPPASEVLSNDKTSVMSVICSSCISDETDSATTGYPDHEKAYICDKCQKPCYQYFFKYKDFQAAAKKDRKGTAQDHINSGGLNDGLSTKGKMLVCKRKKKNYVCNICGVSYKSNMGFHHHYSKHTNVFRYRCEECGKGFHYRRTLYQHKKSHAVDLKCQCFVCLKKLKNQYTLQHHMKRHSVPKIFPCEWCGMVYNYARSYRHHKRTVHKVVTGIQCKTCLKYFENLNFHTCAPFYECDVCGKRFSKRQNFLTHFASHTDAMNEKCNVCHKVFKSIAKLKFHMHLHSTSWSERYPYLCEVCGRGFTLRGSLKIHRKVHVAGKKYRLKFFRSNKLLQEQQTK